MANFTKRPALRVPTSLAGLSPDGFRFLLTGEFGAAYGIFGSTNLSTWTPLGSLTNDFGTSQFTDPGATNRAFRDYRAVVE